MPDEYLFLSIGLFFKFSPHLEKLNSVHPAETNYINYLQALLDCAAIVY